MKALSSRPFANPKNLSATCAIPGSGGCNPVMIDDAELLRRYVDERSEPAFAALVQRKAGLVYSAALRQVGGDTLLAQDVSQTVFIDLARKARQLGDRPELSSWLYTGTRFAALKALREQHRRHIREQEAQAMQDIDRESARDAAWEELRPFIDTAICDLPEPDRAALVLRYFENQPFAAMGEQLGIGESSARMRAERALDKLRALLARRGITSTAAALGLVLATKAVAAPPVGLATLFTGVALANAAAVGTGAGTGGGLLLKLSALKPAPAVTVGAAALGTAGFVSYETAPQTMSAAFLFYVICFGVGLLFTLISAIGAHVFGGHSELGHGFEHGHGGHAQGHAEGGGGSHDMPGFAPLSPTTIATFITAFGGFGMIFSQIAATRSPWLSAPLAAAAGFGIAFLVFLLFSAIFRHTQGTSEGRVADLIGCEATVITPITTDGVGEIAYVQSGSRYSAPARSDDGLAHINGATVKITRIVGTQFYIASA